MPQKHALKSTPTLAAPLICPRCGATTGHTRNGSILSPRGRVQRYQCSTCKKKFHRSLKSIPLREREGYLDIEASQLKASFGHTYSWALKERGGEVLHDSLRHRSLKDEARLLRGLNRALKKFDRIYTYYGTGFDIPFLRTRCLYHGLEFPEYMTLYHTDLYYVVRNRMNLHSKRLASVCEFLGIKGKTPLTPAVWVQASFGDKDALKYIVTHNIEDVKILEKVHERLEPYYQGTRRSV